jgi:hypothetical protein
MELRIGDVIQSKKNPDRKYKIIDRWKNYFDDAVCELQLIKNPDFRIRELEKYLVQDFSKVE